MIYDNTEGGRFAGYFVQDLRYPDGMATEEFKKIYDGFARRILWMDGDVCPGAFQMNTAWYAAVPQRDPIFDEHSHGCEELIGFFGSDPDDPYELGGEIVFTVEGEQRRLTRSTMIFIPPNVRHNPMRILRVDRPIFHFSVITDGRYNGGDVYK
ncbi:MAG: hypothetical protein K5855_10180 [Oscillospiraceae bacterium]|jgi:hypothetical protein|nr:hypothetical protein [Oscillospiraceae bacterium]